MYVVLGIADQAASSTARALLAACLPVRAVLPHAAQSRAWATLGAEVAVADLRDATALQAAFTGVAGAFVAFPIWLDAADPVAENRRVLAALTTALRAAAVPKVVYLSSVGAQRPHRPRAFNWFHEVEQAFQQLSLPTAAIRAAWLMENFRAVLGPARHRGQVPSLLSPPERPVEMVATEDVGQLAARTLAETWTGHRLLELRGPCAYSPSDVTMILSYLLGRPLQTVVIPLPSIKLPTRHGA